MSERRHVAAVIAGLVLLLSGAPARAESPPEEVEAKPTPPRPVAAAPT